MGPKFRFTCMRKDDLVWEKLEASVDAQVEAAKTKDVYREVGRFILKHKPGAAELMHIAVQGGYNLAYRLEYKDGSSVMMRVALPGSTPFADEKFRYEAATMRYVAAHTDIPVPKIYHTGTAAENPTGLGPFIIMDWVNHHQNMSRELMDPELPPDKAPILDPNISQDKLERLYGQMAHIMLQLYNLTFPRIGSLVEEEEGGDVNGSEYGAEKGAQQNAEQVTEQNTEKNTEQNTDKNKEKNTEKNMPTDEAADATTIPSPPPSPPRPISVRGRPLTANMIDLAIHTSGPASVMLPPPGTTYATADDWYAALADMHMAQLAFQYNDAVEDADDARVKYVARQLFRDAVRDGRLAADHDGNGGDGGDGGDGGESKKLFRLFSEDFRPANVLLDADLNVVAVIDWEFAYAAPAAFSSDPPWWLLLEGPEYWQGKEGAAGSAYEGWIEQAEPQFQTFVRLLRDEETRQAATMTTTTTTATTTAHELSRRMQASWDARSWMVRYAARKSWAFDTLWWRYLDAMHFPAHPQSSEPNADQDHRARLAQLREPQRVLMDALVERKLKERDDRKIAH